MNAADVVFALGKGESLKNGGFRPPTHKFRPPSQVLFIIGVIELIELTDNRGVWIVKTWSDQLSGRYSIANEATYAQILLRFKSIGKIPFALKQLLAGNSKYFFTR